MQMAKHRKFLNFEAPDDLLEKIDAAAERSGLDRSKQARALIEYALGVERKPYIPVAQQERLSFNTPHHEAPGKKARKSRKAA